MFTIAELFDIAVQIEKRAEAAYREAAQTAESPAAASLLVWMGDQEASHGELFSKLKKESPEHTDPVTVDELQAGFIEEVMVGASFSLGDVNFRSISRLNDVLRIAIEYEEDTILFYEMLKSFVQEKENKKTIDDIINEEKQHIDKITSFLA